MSYAYNDDGHRQAGGTNDGSLCLGHVSQFSISQHQQNEVLLQWVECGERNVLAIG